MLAKQDLSFCCLMAIACGGYDDESVIDRDDTDVIGVLQQGFRAAQSSGTCAFGARTGSAEDVPSTSRPAR